MKAVVKVKKESRNMIYTDYDEPIVKDDLVKIKIAYMGICGTDLHASEGEYSSTVYPVILGHEFSGTVVEVGADVKNIKVGDRVTSETTFKTCNECECCKNKEYNLCANRKGIGTQINGSMAEFLVSREESVHVIPDNTSLLSASLTEPLACGVHAVIEKGDVQPNDIVVIFGAGAIGLMCAQVAKSIGATVVVAGLDSDIERFKIAKQVGVDYVVNQQREDLTLLINTISNNVGANKVIECAGSAKAINKGLEILKRKGMLIQMGVFAHDEVPVNMAYILHKEIDMVGSRSQKPSSWEKSLELLGSGSIVPEQIVGSFVTLENWEKGFDEMKQGTYVKSIIVLDDIENVMER